MWTATPSGVFISGLAALKPAAREEAVQGIRSKNPMESFPLEPDSEGYVPVVNECLDFYPTTMTPARLWVCVQGILRGTPWTPADPPPPFDVFPIDHVAGCSWTGVHDGITFTFFNGLIGPEIDISIIPVQCFFHQASVDPESHCFANDRQNPAVDKYYGGHVLIVQNVPDDIRSEQTLCDLVPIPKSSEYYSNPRPMDGQFAVHSIMSIANNDFVRVKVDHS